VRDGVFRQDGTGEGAARDISGAGRTAATLLDDHLTVACGDGAVRLLELQRAGGKTLAAEDFLRGSRPERIVP
jgi:methionyl-tRNA formyltransferase